MTSGLGPQILLGPGTEDLHHEYVYFWTKALTKLQHSRVRKCPSCSIKVGPLHGVPSSRGHCEHDRLAQGSTVALSKHRLQVVVVFATQHASDKVQRITVMLGVQIRQRYG